MLAKIKHLFAKNTLLEVLSINSLAVLIRIFTGFITTKLIAIFIGPSGLPLISNFTNFMNSTKTMATLGMQEAVVVQVAEHQENKKLLAEKISTGFYLLLISAVLVSLFIILSAQYINTLLFNTEDYTRFIIIYASIIPFMAMQVFFIASINGLGYYKKVITINIVVTILSFMLSVLLIYNLQLLGALIALLTGQILGLFLLFTQKEIRLIIDQIDFQHINKQSAKTYATYGIMALVTALSIPWMFILVRNNIIEQLGKTQAGYWDAMLRIANFYLLFVGTALTIYYLPKLASLKTKHDFLLAIKNYYKTLMPLVLIGLILTYFLRFFIIKVFLTEEFTPINELFFYQLAADFFKVASLAFSYQFLAKKMFWQYILTELFFAFTFYFMAAYFLAQDGLQGIVQAYLYTYILYFILVVFLFRKILSTSNL